MHRRWVQVAVFSFLTGVFALTCSAQLRPSAQAPGTWIRAGKLIAAAQEAYTLNDGRVFVPPSAFSTTAVVPQVWDPSTNLWSATAPTLYSRLGAASTVLNDGRVLVTGGQNSLNTAEIYNPTTNQWTQTAGLMTVGRYFHRVTRLNDGRVLLTGGCSQLACAAAERSAEIYDPATDTFTPAGSMSEIRTFHTATVLADGRVLIAGGYTNTGTGYSRSADMFDPATGIWTAMPKMTATRSEHTATLMPDGRVLVVGGGTDYGAILKTNEVFDPATAKWSRVAPLPFVLYEHSAILLPTGQVMIAGGTSIKNFELYVILNKVELFDPTTNRFTTAAHMSKTRSQFGITALPDGRVMVVGGDYAVLSDGKVYQGDAEIYQP